MKKAVLLLMLLLSAKIGFTQSSKSHLDDYSKKTGTDDYTKKTGVKMTSMSADKKKSSSYKRPRISPVTGKLMNGDKKVTSKKSKSARRTKSQWNSDQRKQEREYDPGNSH